ncbi:MAG: hypothetical protein QM692_10630 [Thermomicrobiales bacterium]
MEQARFSALIRRLGSRRYALAGLAAVAAFTAGSGLTEEARSKKKKNKNKKFCFRRYTKCGKRCIDVSNDPEHCGDCSTRCDAGVDCVLGVCGGTR